MATDPSTIADTTPAAAPEIDPSTPIVTSEPHASPGESDPSNFYKDDQPKTEQSEGEAPAEGAEGQEAADVEPIAAPNSWSKEDQAQFAALPRDAQEIVSRREKERDNFVQAKSREAAQTRQSVESEARQAFLQLQQNHAAQLERYAQQFEVQQPDLRLLNSEDPAHRTLYFQQEAAYRHATAQRTQAQQEADQARQQAQGLEQHQHQLAIQAEIEVLTEKVPEWSDPSARAKLLDNLQPIAAELGYSPEVMSQARAADIIALRTASEWKAKAAKYDQLNKTKMVPVRAAKQIPPAARANAPAGQGQQTDIAASLYPNDVRRN